MSTATVTQKIDAPVEQVFDVLSDIPNAAATVTAIEKIEMLSEGPVKVGTRWKETRVLFGKASTEEMWFTEFNRPNHYAVEAESCGSHFRTDFRFESQGEGTLVTLQMTTKPISLFAKLMSPLGFLMKGMMIKCFEKDLHDCKAACEENGNGRPSMVN